MNPRAKAGPADSVSLEVEASVPAVNDKKAAACRIVPIPTAHQMRLVPFLAAFDASGCKGLSNP